MVTRADSKLCFVILERSSPSGEIKPRNSVFHIYKILRDISIPPQKNKTIQHKTAGLFCFHKNVLIYKLGQDYLSCPQDVGQSYPNQKPRLS